MIYRFQTDAAYYSTPTPVVEPFEVYWDSDTGEALGLRWQHAAHPYGLHPEAGTVVSDGYLYFDVHVMMTDFDNLPVQFPIRGLISIDHSNPPDGARMAVIQEGSGTAWLAATGTIAEVDDVPPEALPPRV